MMGFWNSIQPRQGNPSPEALEGLARSEEQLERAEQRDREVSRLATWFDERRAQNHFGDALDISFKPRKSHA